jgi:hypothetical protein
VSKHRSEDHQRMRSEVNQRARAEEYEGKGMGSTNKHVPESNKRQSLQSSEAEVRRVLIERVSTVLMDKVSRVPTNKL